MEPIIPIEQIRREAAEAARSYSDVNAACPYPFTTEAGRLFRQEFMAMRGALGAAPELEP
jgi:hypothetical protein